MTCSTMPAFNQRIEQALSARKQQGLQRKLHQIEGGNARELHSAGQRYVNFSSNDYLGLATDKQLTSAWQQGLDKYGNGSGASPLVTGFSPAHAELEQTLCDWLGFERAILFGSGFSANQALLFALLEKQDLLLQDKLNHASLIEAGMLSPATMKRFRHNDIEHLEKLLEPSSLVVTEGVFSMDGDLSLLAEIASKVQPESWLAVDDAHGIGVLGPKGAGSCARAGVVPDVLIVTFGKGFGLSGAAIMCSKALGDYLTQFARHHVYSTAMPPAQAFALNKAAHMIQQQEWRREKLAELSDYYDRLLSDCPEYRYTPTAIKPFVVGESDAANDYSQYLKRQGIWASAIRPPTVAPGSARLRVTLTASHTMHDVELLANQLKRLSQEIG
ncbi:8-amino-7-oxononanoate synthase [Vibrio sinaloensis]|uniref:8-amino-7-oxononanoate synthase n=1 Tax=Photobacterium sp. (strain ATCC 43367) TaxID=379097 RepID=UPI00205A22B5|nr:8-amino-7-oxononanoate synthase [Vibrio sinaloensis]UPQ87029.1 8-amino-7-oxononanoate synthase [Vibrio sinaloensis]